MKALDRFLQGPYVLLFLAAIAFTSVIGAPHTDEVLQFTTWAGAFAFPALIFIMIQRMPDDRVERMGVFARYPGFATAAFFLVEGSAVYRWYPGMMTQDTIVSVIGLYVLFAILTVAELRPQGADR